MTDQKINILITAGKTGGHLFPAIAIAQALKSENKNVEILFAGIGTEFEKRIINSYGFDYADFYSRPIKGRNLFSLLLSLVVIPLSIMQSFMIIFRFKPHMVIGTGAYASFAMVAAAWLTGKKTAIQEQNTIPGLTNRMLSKIVDVIFLNFKETRILSDKKCAIHTGNPVRTVIKSDDDPDLKITENKNKFTVLVSGGSQGASSINNAVVEALTEMKNIKDCTIIHQTGKDDEQTVKESYKKAGIDDAIVKAFFNNLDSYQDIADLMISRAGAGAISEINLKGLPSILIPYPFAADDHQTVNAEELARNNAAIVIPDKELTGDILRHHIERLKNNKNELEKMSRASSGLAMPDAETKIAKTILNMTSGQGL